MGVILECYQSVLLVIKGRGKMRYLIGAMIASPSDLSTYSVWEVENSIMMTWLINSMEQRIGRLYLFYQKTKEVWDAVKEMHLDLEDISQSFGGRSKIQNIGKIHYLSPSILIYSQNCGKKSICFIMLIGSVRMMESYTTRC